MKNVLNLLNNIPYMSKADQSFMTLALLIIISIFIGAIIIVGIIKIISVAVKLRKAKKKKNQKDASEYAALFGGANNIIKTERSLNRILVEVIDRSKVDLEQLMKTACLSGDSNKICLSLLSYQHIDQGSIDTISSLPK